MALNVLVVAGGICGGLLTVFLLVASARMFVMRRRVTRLLKDGDVAGLQELAATSGSVVERSAAVEALGRFPAGQVLDGLVRILEGETEPAVRMLALETITSFGQRAVDPLVRSWRGLAPEEKTGVALSLKALGRAPLTTALATVAEEHPDLVGSLLDESDDALRQAGPDKAPLLGKAEVASLRSVVARFEAADGGGAEEG